MKYIYLLFVSITRRNFYPLTDPMRYFYSLNILVIDGVVGIPCSISQLALYRFLIKAWLWHANVALHLWRCTKLYLYSHFIMHSWLRGAMIKNNFKRDD